MAGTVVDEGGVEGEVSGTVRVFVEKIKPGGLAERYAGVRVAFVFVNQLIVSYLLI